MKCNINKSFAKGLSLLELLVAISVFSVIVLATTGAFASAMSAQRRARAAQNNLESAKTALELMAKTMRFSQGLSGDATSVKMYNSSQKSCISYYYYSGGSWAGTLAIATKPPTGSTSEEKIDSCQGSYSFDSNSFIIKNATSVRFDVDGTTSNSVGKATVHVQLGTDHLQTSVSFRDYQVNNIQGTIP